MTKKAEVNILIVDDEEVMRSLFTDILQEEGHRITTACNGQEAEGMIQKEHFDIAFLDVHMPVMDGVQTLKMIKRLSPKTVIVMMDSYPDLLLDEAEREGAVTCIHKPFHIQEVREVVGKITRGEG